MYEEPGDNGGTNAKEKRNETTSCNLLPNYMNSQHSPM